MKKQLKNIIFGIFLMKIRKYNKNGFIKQFLIISEIIKRYNIKNSTKILLTLKNDEF